MRGGSLREKLDDAAGWVLVGGALAAVIVITALKTNVEGGLGAGVMFVGVLFGAFLAIALHELGHAAGARLVGWRVWIVSVAGVLFRRGHGLRISTAYSHDAGGYVLASPPDAAHDSRWRSIVFTAGGPLVSLLTGPLFLAWFVFLPRDAWWDTPIGAGAHAAVLAFGIASSSAAMWTLWPLRGGRPNDMAMILDAIFKRDPSVDVRGASWAWGLFEHGIEPDAWPRWMHEAVARDMRSPWASPVTPLVIFFCALQAGDETAARAAARRGGEPVGKLMRAYVAAYFDNNHEAAAREIADVQVHPGETSLGLLLDLVTARIAALQGDAQGAARSYAAIANALNADGPRPYWERLLGRIVAQPV